MVRKFLRLLIITYASASISSVDLSAQSDSLSVVDTTAHIQAFEVYLLNEQSISYKRYLWDDWLIRFNVDVSSAFEKRKHEATPYESEYENSSSEFWIGFSFQMYYDFFSNSFINLCLGTGPYGVYTYSSYTSQANGKEDKDVEKEIEYGFLSSLYLEVNIFKNICLLASYDFLISYRERNHTPNVGTEMERTYKTHYWEKTLSVVKIGIAVYF